MDATARAVRLPASTIVATSVSGSNGPSLIPDPLSVDLLVSNVNFGDLNANVNLRSNGVKGIGFAIGARIVINGTTHDTTNNRKPRTASSKAPKLQRSSRPGTRSRFRW
jgi:hypothetical protein